MRERAFAATLLGCFMAFLFWLPMSVQAAPAAPGASQVVQPDGTVIGAVLKGDEWNNRVETESGYTIAKGKDGYWYYVSSYQGKVPVLSPVRAEMKPPRGLKKHLQAP